MKNNIVLIILIAITTACVGENVKKSKEAREKLDAAAKAALSASEELTTVTPFVIDTKGSNNSITFKGDLPKLKSKKNIEKDLDTKSVFDMSIKSVYKKVSGWLYLIMVISAWGAWMLWRRISKSAEGKFLIGTVKSIYKAGKAITEEMVHYDKSSPEWSVLQKLQSKNQQELAEAQRNAPAKK